MIVTNILPATGYLRLNQIIGQNEVTTDEAARNKRHAENLPEDEQKKDRSPKTARSAIPPIIPVSKAAWWAGVKSGKYPQPIKLGQRTTCWKVEDIRALIESAGA